MQLGMCAIISGGGGRRACWDGGREPTEAGKALRDRVQQLVALFASNDDDREIDPPP